jgi:glycosyltransferase involved in cell wall biosynthesis
MNKEHPLVSVVLPCLNEEDAIGTCINKIKNVFTNTGINGEIVVCDNGSTDKSVEIAESMGIRVVHQNLRGYGNAYLKGFSVASGKYLIMGDADDTYDFNLIPEFLNKLTNEGCDFVTGSRHLKGFKDKSMPFLHRYFGNPAITAILNFLSGTRYTDVYSGFRGFSRKVYERIKPISPGMEFNLELAINAGRAGLKIAEIPIQLHPRKGESKLRTFRDGWRSLRMMLLYCPGKVFLLPGIILLTMGLFIHLITLFQLVHYDGRPLGNVTGIFATIFSVVGYQILTLGMFVKTYSWTNRFEDENSILQYFYDIYKLEFGLILGTGTTVIGSLILAFNIVSWLKSNLWPLPNPEWISFAATLTILGICIIFNSLSFSAMSMKKSQD